PIRQGMSLDRKLDILGIVLALVGLLTLLSLLSPINSSWTGSWVSLIGRTFGMGMYIFPFGLIVAGLWLVLRNFERVPQLAVERVLGFILLYANLLTDLHFWVVTRTHQAAFALAENGQGGGYLGAVAWQGLYTALGTGGAAIALAAWLLISLAMALDVTVVDLVRWIPPLIGRFQDWLAERTEAGRERSLAGQGSFSGFKPVPPGSEAGQGLAETHPAADLGPGQSLALTPGLQTEPRAWVLPPVAEILDSGQEVDHDDETDRERARVIEETLNSFGAPAKVVEINRGPTITQFGVEPDFIESRNGRMRVRVGKIASLVDDLALALSARTIRIQAPVPGKSFVGIEVPNEEIASVALRDLIESDAFNRLKSQLRFALGQNVSGNGVAADLAAMPHLLIAGATGSGKSVCVNALICCLLVNNTPDDLRLIMVDPKRVELTGYNGIPHLLAPVVVEMEKVIAALQWVTREMDLRYRKLAEAGSRNIQDFNARVAARGGKKLPYLVVIIDELADLMMLAPDETEKTVTRLAQLARATGIHLVIATQRPSVDVVTGLIKANFPARIAFAVASNVDSRVILDQPGAERLLGRGDMLFQAPDAPAAVRLQGVFVSDNEIQRLVQYWQGFSGAAETAPMAAAGAPDSLPAGVPLKQMPLWEDMAAEENADPLMNEAIDLARRQGRASISMLQRRLRIGYTRAARLIETMEEKGIVGPADPGSGAREILDYGQAAPPVDEQRE
ncbi:MAG TPA: DNA translocase FtsK, partial [Anaerolineales bacterium]